MTSSAPRLTLVLLLFTAACVLAGGIALSRREKVERISPDRLPLRQFAAALQKELLRLEGLHDQHVRHLADRVIMADTGGTRQMCTEIVGIVGCSFLLRTSSREEHVRRPGVAPDAYAVPTFESPSLNRVDLRVLERAHFVSSEGPQGGWLEEPAWPLMYWSRWPANWVVFVTVEPKEVQQAMNGWLEAWLKAQPGFRRMLDGQTALLTPGGRELGMAVVNRAEDEPHWSQPLVTRYGTWQLASWDRLDTRVVYHTPSIAVTVLLSLLVAFLGMFVFTQQRRAHRLAIQRVSFVNRVSHELRTPLTNMLLNLDIIEDSLPQGGRAASRLAMVREEAGRLARLIANVLTFSRREQGSLKLRVVECQPAKVVDAVLEQFAPSFTRHGITVLRNDTMDETPCGLDQDALSQIVANLLSNVEKYAPGAPVLVSTGREGGEFVLKVCDGGPGVSAVDAERIFEPFVRVDDRVAAGVTGTGLGLSIARELAERMGGALDLRPHLIDAGASKGACFVLRVPATTLSAGAKAGSGFPIKAESITPSTSSSS